MLSRKREEFPEGISWDDILKQKSYFNLKDLKNTIPEKPGHYDNVNSRSQICNFAYNAKQILNPHGTYISVLGDGDFAPENMIIAGVSENEVIAKTLERCGPDSIRMLMKNSSVDKLGQTMTNGQILQRLGVNVKVRNRDESTRMIVVDQKNEKDQQDYISALVWKSSAVNGDFVRGEGVSQKPGDMNVYGWSMKLTGEEDRRDPAVQVKSQVLNSAVNFVNNLWQDQSNQDLDSIIAQRHALDELYRIEKAST
jgi:hypothetical protein